MKIYNATFAIFEVDTGDKIESGFETEDEAAEWLMNSLGDDYNAEIDKYKIEVDRG